MTINTKYDVGQIVSYKSKTGTNKTGRIEKIFTNCWGKKVKIGYFVQGVFKEFDESQLNAVIHERQNSGTSCG